MLPYQIPSYQMKSLTNHDVVLFVLANVVECTDDSSIQMSFRPLTRAYKAIPVSIFVDPGKDRYTVCAALIPCLDCQCGGKHQRDLCVSADQLSWDLSWWCKCDCKLTLPSANFPGGGGKSAREPKGNMIGSAVSPMDAPLMYS